MHYIKTNFESMMMSSDLNTEFFQTNNISDYLSRNAELNPDKPALLHPVKITYKKLEAEVDRYSFGLERAGIRKGTLTILMVPVGPEFFIITFALLRVGAIPVLIDPGMGIKALLKSLENLKAEAFIGIPKAHLLRFIRPLDFKTVKIRINTGSFFPFGGEKINNILTDNNPKYKTQTVDNKSIAAIFFTSGSTGPAKGVVYTAGMLNSQIQVTKSQFNIGTEETDLCTFPLLGLFAICHGNSSVIADMDMVHPANLDPAKVIKNINNFGCTQMFGSPMVLNKLSLYCTENRIRLPSLRRIISAGAPVHRKILESFSKLIENEAVIHTPYGATEALPVTDIESGELLSLGSCEDENGICIGYPVKGLQIKIIEITDNEISKWEDAVQVPENETGEIVVKGPWVTTEYFNNHEANRLAKISDSAGQSIWHRMGDLGRMDRQGRIWFYGRKSQRVITTGGTLLTIPCEDVFNKHPLVLRSALVGIPDTVPGFRKPVICIQLVKGTHTLKKILPELQEYGSKNKLTKGISEILFYKDFPVDPRHNAKIFREKLAIWAEKKLK
jgi:acyl-CoA synthetase (AMP-forming)/AMP-acid ligase II